MRHDEGSASIYVVGAVLLITFMSVPVVVIASGFAAYRQAVLAADLAALGGAHESLDAEAAACAAAAQVASANGARLHSCVLSGKALSVEVAVPTGLRPLPEVTASSRAGVTSVPSR